MRHSHELASALGKLLPASYQLAPQPDHPYVLLAPSLLIGGDGQLTAIVIIGSSTTPSALAARITACRLGLPSNTRIVGFITGEPTEAILAFDRDFDEILSSSKDGRLLARYVVSDAHSRVRLDDLMHTKQLHAVRSSAIAQITMLRHRRERPVASSAGLISELSAGHFLFRDRAPGIWRSRREALVFGSRVRALAAGRSMMPSLRHASESGLRSMYTLDGGVPYSVIDVSPSLLLVDSWPTLRADPEKPARAAAFSGWVMASSDNAEDVEQLIERAREFVQRKVYERTQG